MITDDVLIVKKMKVRVAKKILKSQKDTVYTDLLRYKSIKWNRKRKLFLCDTIWGQREVIFL